MELQSLANMERVFNQTALIPVVGHVSAILRIALGIVKSGKNQGDTSKIFTCIIVVFLVLGLLNYQKEIYVK